jgi:prepilin-type N-terminal cleavage/methylation domain-containing protein
MTHAKTRQAGYSLVEMMVAMGVMTVVMGATVASLDQATKMNNAAVLMTGGAAIGPWFVMFFCPDRKQAAIGRVTQKRRRRISFAVAETDFLGEFH